jgi:hypothetical protein
MCWFLKRKAATPAPKTEKNEHSRADEIRKFVRTTYITPARRKGLSHVSFTNEEVQAGLKGVRLQSIVSAIDAAKFTGFAKAKLTKRAGKKGSSEVRWTFEI